MVLTIFHFLLSYTIHTIKKLILSLQLSELLCMQIHVLPPLRSRFLAPTSSLVFLLSHYLPTGNHCSDINHHRFILPALELHIKRIVRYIPPSSNFLGAFWVPGTVPSPGDATVTGQSPSPRAT